MADRTNQFESLELKILNKINDSSNDLNDGDEEKSIELNSVSDDEDDKVSQPLLDQNNELNVSSEPNQSSDPAATQVEVENESLLIRETNLDNLDEIRPIETMQIEEPKTKNKFNFPKVDLKSIMTVLIIGVGFLFMFFVLIVLLPSCIDSLDYTEYALRRNTLTGSVNDKYVYEPGLHFVLPFTDWIKFNKTVHSIRLNSLTLFTTDKLQVNVTFMVYYFLNKDNIGKLYRNYGTSYQNLIASVCKSELQILGQKYSIDDYRLKRVEIKRYFKDKIAVRLNSYGLKLHDLLMLQLRFTNRINSINLKRMIVGIQNEEAVHNKTSELIRQETRYQVEVLKNKANLELESAALKSNNTIVKPELIEQQAKLELASLYGMTSNLRGLEFYDRTQRNITKKVLSFCWVTSLLYMKDNLNFVNTENQFVPTFGIVSI